MIQIKGFIIVKVPKESINIPLSKNKYEIVKKLSEFKENDWEIIVEHSKDIGFDLSMFGLFYRKSFKNHLDNQNSNYLCESAKESGFTLLKSLNIDCELNELLILKIIE